MTPEQALSLIKQALHKAVPKASGEVRPETHLIKDGLIDSLDSMAFLYELEALCGGPLEEITDDFNDFRVVTLMEMLDKR